MISLKKKYRRKSTSDNKYQIQAQYPLIPIWFDVHEYDGEFDISFPVIFDSVVDADSYIDIVRGSK